MSDKAESTVKPPWIEYSGMDPIWGGWRQGHSEAWLLDVFLPFWQGLSPEDRKHYLETWPPPDDDWNYYLSVLWIK